LQKKGSHKKLLKSQDNDSDVKAPTENDIPESGPAEDEDIASPRPKRSKRLLRSTGEDKEPVAASDLENPADAAENISHDYHDAEESQDQTPTA
jgi:DNA helicase INO80